MSDASRPLAAGQDGMEHLGRITVGCSTAEEQLLEALRDTMGAGADRDGMEALLLERGK